MAGGQQPQDAGLTPPAASRDRYAARACPPYGECYPGSMRKRTVLFVEDDADDWELTLIYLRAEGFDHEIRWLRGAPDALEYLRSAEGGKLPPPDLLISDCRMPRMSGIEMLEKIRGMERWKELPVAFLSSSGDDRDRDRALQLGASLFLSKPESAEQFREVVTRLKGLLVER